MATREEMIKMLNTMEDDVQEWVARNIWNYPGKFSEDIVKDFVWHALRHAEEEGMGYSGTDGEKLYIYWDVGDYEVSYITYDKVFNANMLTEEMMDDLIIEEV